MLKCCLGTKIKNCQRGAVIVLFALLLPVLFGFMGLGIDVGLAYVEKGKVQDIADSAALAGAAKLSANGNNDMDAIKTAVESYVKANGISLGENDMLRKDADEWDDKETLAAGQDALVAYGVVSVTNSEGVAVDRVRVRVNKRVPTFFVNVLGDFSDGFVVVAKAAAEGEGEEVVTTAEGPGMIAFGALNFFTTNIHDRYDENNARGYGSDIYAAGAITINGKLMLAGNYYASSESGNIQIKDQGNKNGYAFTKIDPNDLSVPINKRVSELKSECKNILDNKDKSTYQVIETGDIKKVDGKNVAIIGNTELGGSNSIDNLIIDIKGVDCVVLDTSGITFGNVYISGKAYIEGNSNMFTGRLYSNTELNIFGDYNNYTQMLSETVNVGQGFYDSKKNRKFTSSFNSVKNTFTGGSGAGSGGTGGSGSGSGPTITVGNLKLVE